MIAVINDSEASVGLIRVLLAITVVFAHSPWNGGMVFVGPRVAVQLFYITSGFLISYVLTERKDYLSHWNFYQSRLIRLYPMYLVVAIITLFAFWLLNPAFFSLYRAIPTSAVMMLGVTNLTLFGQDWVMFTAVNGDVFHFSTNFKLSEFELWKGLLVPQAWSLGVELSFYAMAPFVLRRRVALFVLFFASILIRVYLFAIGIGATDPWTYRFFPTELAFFLVGAISHQLLLPLYLRLDTAQLKCVSRTATYGFLIFVVSYFLIPIGGAFKSPVLFVTFVTLLPLFFTYQRFNSFDRSVGELSYPIYVGHYLVIFLVEYFLTPYLNHSPALISSFNVVFSVTFAILLNRFIGIPVEKFRTQWRSVAATSHTSS